MVLSSVSLCISSDSLPEWGVTILQADEEMDAGDVWKSCKFAVPHSSTLTKSAFYNKVQTYVLIWGVDRTETPQATGFQCVSFYEHRQVSGPTNHVLFFPDLDAGVFSQQVHFWE